MYDPQLKNFIKEANFGCFNGTYGITGTTHSAIIKQNNHN